MFDADLEKEKKALKRIKVYLAAFNRDFKFVRSEHRDELIDAIDCIIGRINCELTDDDSQLEFMAIKDGIRSKT